MKKLLCILLSLILFLTVTMTAVADPVIADDSVQLVRIEKGNPGAQRVIYCETLKVALNNAISGDIIELLDDVTVNSPISIPENTKLTFVSAIKRKALIVGANIPTKFSEEPKTVRKNFDGTLFNIGKGSIVTFQNIVLDGNNKSGKKGGLIYAQNGASVSLIKGSANSGVTLKNSKLGNGSFGGAIYAENNTAVTIENAVFSGNSSSCGNDIYLKKKTSLIIDNNTVAKIRLCGDLSGDYNVNILDMVQLKKILASKPSSVAENCSPDTNCDGKTNSYDLAELVGIILSCY